jgi:hypothetical protein
LTKELLLSAPLRSRRVTTSHGIHLNEQDAKTDADIFRVPLDDLFRAASDPKMLRYENEGKTLVSFVVDYDITRRN